MNTILHATHGQSTPTKYRLSPDKAALIRVNPPLNMSVMEGAAYLGCSPRKLRELIAARKVRHARLGKKIILRIAYLDELVSVTA